MVCELFFEVVVIEGKEFIGEYVIDDHVVHDRCVECHQDVSAASFGVFLDFFFGFGFELVYKVFEVVEHVVHVC